MGAQAKFVVYAMTAGMFGALSGAVGKMSVTSDLVIESYLRVLLFLFNGVCTAQMWRYYLKALSLGPTPTCQILNTGTNFVVSALLGLAVFDETVNQMWVFGAICVAAGMGIIASDPGVPSVN